MNHCSATTRQQWLFSKVAKTDGAADGAGTLSEPNKKLCFDNMQKDRGMFGLFGCHGFGSQQWLLQDGLIKSADMKDTCTMLGCFLMVGFLLKDAVLDLMPATTMKPAKVCSNSVPLTTSTLTMHSVIQPVASCPQH
jgi:hypothetical protein